MASPLEKTTVCSRSDSASVDLPLDLSAKASSSLSLPFKAATADVSVSVEPGKGKLKSTEPTTPAFAEHSIGAAKDDELNHPRFNLQSIEEKVDNADREIKAYKDTYARNDVLIYNFLHLYAVSVPVIVAGILSSQHIQKAQWRWPVILSGLVSGSIVVALILSVFEQFRALKHGRQLQKQRDSAIDGFFAKETSLATKRGRFLSYGNDIFEETSAYYWGVSKAEDRFTYYGWWGSRAAFLLVLISISVCAVIISYFDAYI